MLILTSVDALVDQRKKFNCIGPIPGKLMTGNNCITWGPGGATRMSRGYQARPKIHVIRVVFQDKALYARTSFRGAKTCKIGKKGCVFGHTDKFWKGHNGQIKKNACKNAYLGSIFIN